MHTHHKMNMPTTMFINMHTTYHTSAILANAGAV